MNNVASLAVLTFIVIAAVFPEAGKWMLGNLVQVFAPFLHPILTLVVIWWGVRILLGGGKKKKK